MRPKIDEGSVYVFAGLFAGQRRRGTLKLLGEVGRGISRPVRVLVDGTREGFLKDSSDVDDSDDLELALHALGCALGVRMAEEYRVLGGDGQKLGLLSLDVAQASQSRFLELRRVQRLLWERVQDGRLAKSRWMEEWLEVLTHRAFPEDTDNYECLCRDRADLLRAVRFPLHCMEAFAPEAGACMEGFRREYMRMLLFDLFTGQTDRTTDNYGIVLGADGSYELAPLFDNATLQKPYLAWGQYALNGMLLEREELCAALFSEYAPECVPLAGQMLAAYEAHGEELLACAGYWIENEGLPVLRKRLSEGAAMLGRALAEAAAGEDTT